MKRSAIRRTKHDRRAVRASLDHDRQYRKALREVEFSAQVKARASAKGGHRCQAQLEGCAGQVDAHHHRRLKSQGGDGTEENDLPCCLSCHALIHKWVEWSQRHGLIVKSYSDPAAVSVARGCPLDCTVDHAGQ